MAAPTVERDDLDAASRAAVARVRAARNIPGDHDCGAAGDGPDRAHTDPADRMPDTY